jgi:activator of HSP90 ATPase
MSDIHQTVRFAAPAERVYALLLSAEDFSRLSGAPAQIDAAEGGAFSLFGGFVTGRSIELAPSHRIVQGWRASNWPPGVYSMVRFDLHDDPGGTRLVLEQQGVPKDVVQDFVDAWAPKYWDPMRIHLET